jgi:hypothetical protein
MLKDIPLNKEHIFDKNSHIYFISYVCLYDTTAKNSYKSFQFPMDLNISSMPEKYLQMRCPEKIPTNI